MLVNGVVDEATFKFEIMFYEEVVSLACCYRGLPGDTTWEEIRRRLNDKFLATLSTEAPCPAPLPPLPCEFVELPDFSGLIMMTDDSQPLAPAVNTNTAEVLCSDLALGGANTSSTSPTVGVKFKFKSSTAECIEMDALPSSAPISSLPSSTLGTQVPDTLNLLDIMLVDMLDDAKSPTFTTMHSVDDHNSSCKCHFLPKILESIFTLSSSGL